MSRPRAAYSWVLRKTKGKEARDGEEDCRRLGRGRQEGGRGSGGAGRGAVGVVEVDGGPGEGAGGEAGDDAKAAKRWAEKLCRLLEAGRMDDVLAALRRPGAGAEERAKAVRCLSERRGQMRYGECRSLGLPIGSGRVEGDLTAGRSVIAADDVEPLLGGTALESAGIEVDPVNQRLKRLPALRLKARWCGRPVAPAAKDGRFGQAP